MALSKIGRIVGYDASAISREIKRNTGGRGYRYKQADAKAVERRVSASNTPQKLTPMLVQSSNKNYWKSGAPIKFQVV